MNYAITFALLSSIFAGINDVIFKKYADKNLSIGMYIFGIGITWTVLQIVKFKYNNIPFDFDITTVTYGIAAGLFLILSNILFLRSLTHINISLGSTIYRLNTIVVVILSFFFLHESLGLIKLAGISCGIIAVLFLYQKGNNSFHNSNSSLFFVAVIIASIFRAAFGVVSKAGILSKAEPEIMLLIISTCWILGGAGYAKFQEKHFRITGEMTAYSILSGTFAFLIVNFLMLAIEYGQASIVIPVANMSFVIAVTISAATKMEVLNFRKYLAIGFAAVSIILLSKL